MRIPRLIALAITMSLALTLLAFAACGGDDDDKDKTTTPTGSGQSNGGATKTTAASATQASDGGDDGGDNATDDPFAALENLTGDIEQQTGKVSYEVTDADGTVSTMTFYSKPGKSRFDTADSDGNATSTITNDDGTFICESSSQACIGYGNTFAGAGLGLGFASFLSADTISLYVAAAQAAGVDVDQSSETHAGIDADCFSWSDDTEPTDVSTGKLCFGGDQNILLYEEFGDSTGTTKFEATQYTSDVSDSDFDTPYPVSTIIG